MFLLGVVLIFALSTTVNSQVVCTADAACSVDCSDSSTTCGSSKTIDATGATSLNILCNEAYSCQYSTILIPNATDASTTIQCSLNSCYGTKVYYLADATATPSTHNLNIICSNTNGGCNSMKVYASNAGQFSLHCDGVQCQSVELFVENVDTVNLQCDGSTSSSSRGCYSMELHADNANTLSISASPNGLHSGEFHGENIGTAFDITCVGDTTYYPGCNGGAEFYVPQNDADLSKFTLNCLGTGCYNIELHKYSGFASISNANINWNGCLQCPEGLSDCFSKIYTYCGASTNDYFPISSSYTPNCGETLDCPHCNTVYDVFYNAYTEDTSDTDCVLPTNMISCAANVDCVIDCSTESCTAQIIDASLSSGLSLDCTVAEACKDSSVILPNDITSTSTITCGATDACDTLRLSFYGDASSAPDGHSISLECNTIDDSCSSVVINADKAGNLTMLCDGIKCSDTTINADNADTIDITCTGPPTTDSAYSAYGCYDITINAADATSSVDIKCDGKNGCFNTKLYAKRAASVTLDINGDASSSSNEFHGEEAGSFDITCYGGFDSQDTEFASCYNMEFYVPDTITSTNFKLNCYGKGCDDIDVLSVNGFKSATADNFYFNGCNDCKLNTVDIGDGSYCVDNLALGCIDTAISTTDYKSDTYDGYACTDAQYDCGCAEAATVINAAFTNANPADTDSCSSSLFTDDWEPEPESNTVTVVVVLLFVLLILCVIAGYLRRFWLKFQWEKRKETKDELQSNITAGDTTKQDEYEEICKTTPDEYIEPEMKHWMDYGLYYGLEPFFNLFYDRWDKYFAYIGWLGEFIEIIVTLWIIFSLLSPNAAFACCSYSMESSKCDSAKAMGEDLSLISRDENGWCVVDGTPCVRSYYYDADDATAMFECFGADRIELAQEWNEEVCGADASRKVVRGNSTWIIIVLLFKLIKIGWDYYIQILEFKEKKRVAKENTRIVSEYREKHPEWQPDEQKEPKRKSLEPVDGKEQDKTDEEAATQKSVVDTNEVPKDDGVPKDEVPKDNDDVVTDGPVLVSEKAIRVCWCISTEDEHWKKFYPYCVAIMFFLGSTLSVAVLAGLDATGGISIVDCSYDSTDYSSYSNDACYNVGKCANAGTTSSSMTVEGKSYETVYAVINNNVALEGPQILAIFATIIGYIGYVPMLREKLNALLVKRGLKEAEAEADELLDFESWNGLF